MVLVSGFTASPKGDGATWMVAVTLKQLAATAGDGDATAAPAVDTSTVVATLSRHTARRCSLITPASFIRGGAGPVQRLAGRAACPPWIRQGVPDVNVNCGRHGSAEA